MGRLSVVVVRGEGGEVVVQLCGHELTERKSSIMYFGFLEMFDQYVIRCEIATAFLFKLCLILSDGSAINGVVFVWNQFLDDRTFFGVGPRVF